MPNEFTAAERAEIAKANPLPDVPPPVVVAPDSEAAALINAGATPVTVDVEALQRQIQELTDRMNAQAVQLGIPTNPVGAAVANLIAHVKARANANPGFDFSELADQLASLGETPTATDAELIRTLVEDVLEAGPALETHYLRVLARDLHKETLKASKGKAA